MKTGKRADTLFSEFWQKHVMGNHNVDLDEMTKYTLMRWCFREGFNARGERDSQMQRRDEHG